MKNDHKSVLVPIETWEYNSPYLKFLGKTADIGLFAESFIYYDKIYVNLLTVREFEEFVGFFIRGNKIDHLIELVRNKVINFLYYSFMSSAINNPQNGEFSIWNIQTPKLYQSDLIRLVVNKANLLITTKRRELLWNAIVENVIDEHSSEYEPIVGDARKAMHDASKCELLIQAYIDEIYKRLQLGRPPEIECAIADKAQGKWNINVNVDFKEIDKLTNHKLDFRPEMPLIGEVNSNKLIWTASKRGYDLFLGNVMSQVVGNKLYEAETKIQKTEALITDLKRRVEFPDIRQHVNIGDLTIEDVLNIRTHATKFRNWLQQEGERDRDAFFAYHNEVAKASGFTKHTSSVLKIFGNITEVIGVPTYQLITKDTSLVTAVPAAGISYAAGEFLKKVADEIAQDWKPLVFGEWLKKEVSKHRN